MGFVLEIELEGLPKTTNAGNRAHWSIKTKEVKHWKRMIYMATLANHKRPVAPLQRASLTLTRCSSAEPDYDGLVSSWKHIIDALIEAKVIANDKFSNIGQSKYLWEKATRGKGHIRIKVEEIE